jgi:hypothetical protein
LTITTISETERYAAAWKDRRRRFLIYWAESYSLFFILIALALPRWFPDSSKYTLLLPAWFVGYIAAGVWLNRFRYPRCGNLFYWKWTWKIERAKDWRACRHCGLKQDSEP